MGQKTLPTIWGTYTEFGKIDRVKKIKDYGFVHYEERDDAVKALDAMNGQV
jgi:RNA recognition motif-containing protein